MLRLLRTAFALVLLAVPANAAGIDDGLYAPPPPADAAFVRYLGDDAIALGGVKLEGQKYQLVKQGAYTLSRHNEVAGLQVDAGKRYTLSAYTGLHLLQDPQLENRSRSMLVLYNFTDKPALDLVTADGKLSIINGVGANMNGSRVVQPLQVDLAIAANGSQIAKIEPIALERGGSYSLIATGSGDAIALQLLKPEPGSN